MRNKIIIILVMVSLVILLLISCSFAYINYAKNQELIIEVGNFEVDNLEVNSTVVEKEIKISALEKSLSKLQSNLQESQVEVENLKIANVKLQTEIDESITKYELLRDQHSTQQSILENLVNDTTATNQCLIYEDSIIKIYHEEEQVIKLFGQPLTENIVINDGAGIWYLKDLYTKTSEYSDFVIFYIGDTNGENYKVTSIDTASYEVRTLRNISVGDSSEYLLEVYPMLKEAEWSKEETIYYCEVREYGGSIKFKIVDGVISEIGLSRSYT